MPVQPSRFFAWRVSCVFCALLLPLGLFAKPIRLQNETIQPVAGRNALVAADAIPADSLVLIQFSGALEAKSRALLEEMGVQLLRYVPDDTFVADLNGVSPDQVRQFGFVSWVGVYRPEHKMQRALLSGLSSTNASFLAKGTNTSASVSVSLLLSPRAASNELQSARSILTAVNQESHLAAGVVWRGEVSAAQLPRLAQSRAVLWIEPGPKIRLFDEAASRIVAGDGPPGKTLAQSLGYDGAGVTVAVADSGLDSGDTNSLHPDITGRVVGLFYYGTPGQLEDAADEHSHGTHCAGIIAGNGATGEKDENGLLYGLGVAPGANLIGQRIFDAVGGYAPPPSFEKLTRDAKSAGADIGSNSWGDDTQGRYDISAMEFDALVRDADALTFGEQPYILEFSAGNAGPGAQTVGSPAVAKNVIATGASQNERFNLPLEEFAIYADGRDAMADFSSRGPCADGRIKPDVVAPGSWIASLRSVYANDDYAWWPISDNYMYQGGTSQAGPHVSGAAAVFVQFLKSTHAGAIPSPALVKAALINSAADMDDGFTTGSVPNGDEGWGRVDLPALLASARNYDFTDQSVLLTNGGVFEKRVLVGSANEPFKITLTYTDVPGFPAAGIALVNDLDLEVVGPNGRLYRGNRFEEGESIPDPIGADTINNVEAVHLLAPVPGEYIIRVRGSRIVEDARPLAAPVDQDFALVVSGTFAAPGTGIVTLDRPVYRVPAQINVALVDYNLAGQPAANVTLRSGVESGGEILSLHANGSSGLFTGAVATATGPAIPADGKLQVAHGNVIEVTYVDAAPAANRTATALADLQAPVISGLFATNQFGQISVLWNTDEGAQGEVYYGISSPNLALTNRFLLTEHDFALPNIPAEAVVKIFVVAQDEAGNRATNNNGGNFLTITNLQPPRILLVDSFRDYELFGFPIADAPPLSGYTDALNQLGGAYDVFNATEGVEPTQNQLNAYRCVIWRISDLEAPSVPLAQRITNYVHQGGSLLIASMEGVTRFTEAGLASFNTGTLQIQSYTEDQSVDEISGVPGEALGNGINTALDYTPYDEILTFAGTTDPSDWIVPNTNAAAAIVSGGAVVGLRAPKTGVDLPGRVVFLSFPLDAVPLGGDGGNDRVGLLRNILTFLAPAPNSSTITLDSDIYSLPGRAVVEVEDADLQGQQQLAVTVHSPATPNPLVLSLLETTRRGLFRGSVIFTPTNTGAPGTLLARANDAIRFDYADASAGSTISVTATIETNAPIISGVFADPGYLEALVSWETSKPADSLVQYSESPSSFPNNFIAYDSSPATEHALYLTGLKPNTTYYVRVSSRDRAGNTTMDDNGGQLYTFTTLLPLLPPWSDDNETNSLDWSTFSSTDSEQDWMRGTPGNGETAHSGTNCWGSNLDGGPVGQMEAYLVSPGILLNGGNKATLRFWHNYDFFPQGDFDIQLAAVQIITNIATEPILLAQMPEDVSGGWEPAEFDLTPYMGNIVYVVWYHFVFSFDALPRLGWLVDDVSITVDNIVPGTVRITNNLSQAVYALSGPSGRTGTGYGVNITNAAPGVYTIQYGEIPYYLTPPPQTNTLAANGSIVFTGNYTFADANANTIPDGWETAQFGSVNPNRSATTDTDGDGLPDYAEFVAGTDPKNATQTFHLDAKMATGDLQMTWPSAPGHGYRILGSTNLTVWTPFSDWLRATSSSTTQALPPRTNGAPFLFRIEARP